MVSLFRLFAYFPLWLLHGLGAVLGWIVFAASGTYRQRFLANAALAGYSFAQVRSAVGHAGRMTAESPRIWFGAPVPVQWHGEDCIDRAVQREQGMVFLTPHMGCFEVTGQAIAQHCFERTGPMTVLYRPARNARLAELMRGARE